MQSETKQSRSTWSLLKHQAINSIQAPAAVNWCFTTFVCEHINYVRGDRQDDFFFIEMTCFWLSETKHHEIILPVLDSSGIKDAVTEVFTCNENRFIDDWKIQNQ